MLWAMRQWQHDRAPPTAGSPLHEGFKAAGGLEVLPDFAIAMDAFLFGARRAIRIHLPTCAMVSHDEATLVASCGLEQRCAATLRPRFLRLISLISMQAGGGEKVGRIA